MGVSGTTDDSKGVPPPPPTKNASGATSSPATTNPRPQPSTAPGPGPALRQAIKSRMGRLSAKLTASGEVKPPSLAVTTMKSLNGEDEDAIATVGLAAEKSTFSTSSRKTISTASSVNSSRTTNSTANSSCSYADSSIVSSIYDGRQPGQITISVKTLMGDSFDVDIFPKETIDDVKRIIYDLKGIPVESQMLVRLERELRDSLTLTDCGLQDGSSVSLVVKMTGGPGAPIRLKKPVKEEESVVLLLCKQDEDLYMLELHMNSSTQKRGKDDEKHVYKVASFRPFSSSFKMISGLSLNEAECEELQEDLKKSLVEMKEEGEEENSDSVEDGPQRDRKVDEEEEGTPKRRKKSSKSVRLVHSAKSDRPESAASRVSTGTFLSIVEDGYSSNSDNRSRVSSSEDFFDDFEAPSDSYYRCAPTSAQTVKEIHRYADFDVDDIIGKCGNRPATAICIMRVMTRADSLTFQSTSSSPPTHRRAKSRAYSAAKSVGGDSQIEIITEDLPKQGSLLQRNSSVDLEAHLEETGRDTVPGLQIPQHENLCCNTFLTSTDKLVGVVALSARDNPQPPPPHHQFSSLQPTSKRFIKSSTSSSSSSSSSVATSTSFQDQISISVDSRFESSFDLSELASSISNTKPSKKIVDSLALNRNVDSVFPKLEPSNYIDENSTGTLVHFESVFPKQILDITSKSGKPITPISAIITSRKNTPSKRSVKSRKSSPPSSGSGGGNGKAGNNILNPKKIFKAPIVNVPDQGNCTCCKKKLGPTTIYKCRCGQIFCGKHRFEDKHNCSFDYKAAAKAGLVRENPKVSHDKITKL